MRMSDAMSYCSLTSSSGFGLARIGFAARRRFGDEAQAHPGAAFAGRFLRRVEQLDAAAMLLENAADDGETEAGALLARRHIGLEQAVAVFLRQADAVVDHVDDDVVAVASQPTPGCGRARARRGGTAAIASVAFLMMLVSACEISRRSNCAGIGLSAISTSISMSAIADAHQEHDLAHGVGDVLGRDHRLRHAGEASRTRRPCA